MSLVLMSSTSAWALDSSSAFNSVPARFRTEELTLGSRGLGEICYSRKTMPDGTVCDPSYLSEVKESLLLARAFIGNGYSSLNNADSFVNKPLTKDYLQNLFQKQNANAVEANLGLSFTTSFFQAAFSPYRVQYASEVHNPNNPVVAVHAAIERAFVFSTGSSIREFVPELHDISVGTRLRILERKFVHGTFSLIDVATRDPIDYLPQRKQNAVLLDPSIAWVPTGNSWHLRVSLNAKNIGYSSGNYNEYPDSVDFGGGVGIEAPIRYGKLRLGLDFVDFIEAENFVDRFRFGISYQLGLIEVMAGVNSNSLTSGISFLLSFIQAGVVYEISRDDLDNGKEETRIATEISVRF